MKKAVYIYALLTCDNTVKYVGKTICLSQRMSRHFRNKPWLCHYRILEICDASSWPDREKYWIAYYGLENLENISPGGCGPKISGPRSIDVKLKISATSKGKILSEAAKRKLSTANKGKILSEETKAKIGLASKNRVRTSAWGTKISLVNTGKKRSDEARQNISNGQKGDKHWRRKRALSLVS